MKKKLQAGAWAGIVFLAIGILFFAYSLIYPYSSEVGPGSGFFPIWISGFLIVLALIYIYESVKGNDSAEEITKESFKKVLMIIIFMVLFVLFLPVAGFNISGTAFLFAMFFKSYKLAKNLIISVISTLAIYFLFLLLGVQLPLNALGF
ncbi:MAG TPA: tripartite tricarboxylate transporter TctB family protein [Rectinemataceae bacterium]|nr:tripartite tricarboxylate transporter TctB family protein [Rectinemataceae bacterium]